MLVIWLSKLLPPRADEVYSNAFLNIFFELNMSETSGLSHASNLFVSMSTENGIQALPKLFSEVTKFSSNSYVLGSE